MAITHIEFCKVGFISNQTSVPVVDGESIVSETITPSGSNQQSSAAVKGYVRVYTDTAVYLAFGANPNALSGTGSRAYLPAGAVEIFQVDEGNKVAVVTA